MLGTTVPNRKIVPETRRHERCQHLERAGAGLEPVLEQLTKGQAMCSCGAWHLKAKLCCQSWTDSKKGLPRRASVAKVCQDMPSSTKALWLPSGPRAVRASPLAIALHHSGVRLQAPCPSQNLNPFR